MSINSFSSSSTRAGSVSEPAESVIPSSSDQQRRTLVLCFDGTGDQFDNNNSNIVKFFSALKKDDPSHQMVYYQVRSAILPLDFPSLTVGTIKSGIGTYTIPQLVSPFWSKVTKTVDMMIGNHLDAHVMGGYEFLMQNYKEGDKICLFGFSRGAYTARALAGMLHKVGLLPQCNYQQVPFAYKMYTQDDKDGWDQSNEFKKAFSIDVRVEFVGVWDTVSSVGIVPRTLPFTKANNHIRYFRHALSLDERRARFMPNFYNRSTEEDMQFVLREDDLAADPECGSKNEQKPVECSQTDVEEVWFAGCHGDVGGGYVKNTERFSLARIPLRWMIRECFKTNTGIQFLSSKLKLMGVDPTTLHPVRPRPPAVHGNRREADPKCPFVSEEHEDLSDALSDMYDQLQLRPFWWILEVVPQQQQYQRDNDTWETTVRANMGEGRPVPKQDKIVKLHRSVDIRMNAIPKYRPKANLEWSTMKSIWID
ncbi:hypothetical protein J3A83DRAFT_3177895 [Scleroderma citrinum]